jgi:hypothetical protein
MAAALWGSTPTTHQLTPADLRGLGKGLLKAPLEGRNRRMVTVPDRVVLIGSRSIRGRPGGEKRMPSLSSTGSTYTRISSTRPRCRHWAATSAPRISRLLPPAALRAVATLPRCHR